MNHEQPSEHLLQRVLRVAQLLLYTESSKEGETTSYQREEFDPSCNTLGKDNLHQKRGKKPGRGKKV